MVGPDTDEEALLTAHVVGEGANDDGTGTVLVSGVGRLLANVEDDPETRVCLPVFGAEEVGLFGAYHWVDTRDHDTVKCIVNVDGAGYSRNLDVHTCGFDAIGDAFSEVSDGLAVPISVESGVRPHFDHWRLVQEGSRARRPGRSRTGAAAGGATPTATRSANSTAATSATSRWG